MKQKFKLEVTLLYYTQLKGVLCRSNMLKNRVTVVQL